ncbi:MAG: EAL domain-containing protein [Woeseiaceae bacterium]
MQWRRVPWPVIALVALALALLARTSGDLAQKVEYDVADIGFRVLRHTIDSDVVIVGIDAKSLAELQEWPWPRRFHAALISKIAEAGPKRLFLDIDFSARSSPEDDAALAARFAGWRGEPIILPAYYQQTSSTSDDLTFTQPMPALRPYASLASVNLIPSADGLVRSMQGAWSIEGRVLPSVAAVLSTPSGDAKGDVLLDFSIDPGSFDFVSYGDVLADRVPAERFAGKTVLVGATAIELGDMVSVPVYRSLPGVAVLAIAAETLRAGLHSKLTAGRYWTLVAVWTALFSFLFCRLSWRRNIVVAVSGLAFIAGTELYLYAGLRMVLEFVPFALATSIAYVLSTLKSLEDETLRAIAFSLGIRKRDALLKSIVQSSTDAILCMAANGRILTANPAAATLFSCDHAVLCKASIHDFIPGLLNAEAPGTRLSLEELCGSISEWEAHPASASPDDSFPVDVSVSRINLKDERLYTAIVRDISERKAQQRQLQFQATHDPLTTLPNRPALAAHLDAVLAQSSIRQATALLMIDLNRFKEVNDTLGHNVGDYVLYEVARRLQSVVAERGFIARIGGDEFALVVHDCSDSSNVAGLSQELVDSLKVPVETCGVSIDVGLSIGISLFPHDADDAETLLKRADIAMYVAKKSRSGFEFYDAANDRHSLRKLTIAGHLRRAIANDELRLRFQPQVNLKNGRVESVEALLRWDDATLGTVNPDEFIGLAEMTDLIQPLTEWTLAAAFRQIVHWQERGLRLRVAINISARILQDGGFPVRLGAAMASMGIPPEQVELEITESAMMLDPQHALRVIHALDDLGVFISIDDFGTGYSSLAYLRDLPVHAVKLDKSFVLNIDKHEDDRAIVESTAQLAHALKLQIVAEGVETAAAVQYLANLGYDYAQGYWYAAAMPPDVLTGWIESFNAGTVDSRSCRVVVAT